MREALPCDIERRVGVPRVVGVDDVDRAGGIVERAEAEQSRADGKMLAEAGVLCHDRASAGEIRRAAIAEPTGPEVDVLLLRDREFAARARDESPVGIDVF